ncbi:hypothetical protein T12_16905 [Trichinella patagoniensis]|uniref:Secreted protein n=1 Tax=Trichinella patagoniensis TaxID=990121 RepID=A0A0V0ZN57_9BILA|nr:hypothetical protein T12_16905 [Trichinella patagoniensis]
METVMSVVVLQRQLALAVVAEQLPLLGWIPCGQADNRRTTDDPLVHFGRRSSSRTGDLIFTLSRTSIYIPLATGVNLSNTSTWLG